MHCSCFIHWSHEDGVFCCWGRGGRTAASFFNASKASRRSSLWRVGGRDEVWAMGSALTGWWFQTFFIFTPHLGKWSNFTNIFQLVWNHQPVKVFLVQRINSATARTHTHTHIQWIVIFSPVKIWFCLGGIHRKCWLTLPETNIAPKNGWLEYYFPIGEAYFRGYVSFREGNWNSGETFHFFFVWRDRGGGTCYVSWLEDDRFFFPLVRWASPQMIQNNHPWCFPSRKGEKKWLYRYVYYVSVVSVVTCSKRPSVTFHPYVIITL